MWSLYGLYSGGLYGIFGCCSLSEGVQGFAAVITREEATRMAEYCHDYTDDKVYRVWSYDTSVLTMGVAMRNAFVIR